VTPLLVAVLAVGGLVALSAFFSSSETAILSLPAGLDVGSAGDADADTLRELRADPHRLLVTLLVGNNVVNAAISSVVTVLAVEALPAGAGVAVATGVASAVVLVFGEIVPKSYGLGHAETWSLRVARPVRLVEVLLGPVVAVFDLVTRRLSAALGGEARIEEPYED
jgi:Mg2+/Co2+ transporter CorB